MDFKPTFIRLKDKPGLNISADRRLRDGGGGRGSGRQGGGGGGALAFTPSSTSIKCFYPENIYRLKFNFKIYLKFTCLL